MSVITQNGDIEDQMLNIPFSQFEILIRDNLSITLTLNKQPYHRQFVWNNTLMFLNVEHLGQFNVRTTTELKPFQLAINELINTEQEILRHLQLFLKTLINHNVFTNPTPTITENIVIVVY